MLSIAISTFLSAGYVYVGMDHFALPTDPLAIAKRQGRLHRNFQGYSTQPDCDLIALGVSSIGRVGSTYSQNAKTLDEYYDHINQGKLPVVRGLALTSDDLVRRAVIMALMCQGELQFEAVELAYMIDFKQYFAAELVSLKALEKEGLVIVDDASIKVTSRGWFFVRGIAMLFDRHLQTDQNRAIFSKIIQISRYEKAEPRFAKGLALMLNVITRTPKKAPAGDNRGEVGANTMKVLIQG